MLSSSVGSLIWVKPNPFLSHLLGPSFKPNPFSLRLLQEYAMSILAERFANTPEDPQRHIRISEWVQDTTPGVFDEEVN
ncbi:hypothetical protein DPMN_184121 [Dreissena polymorpha]|uniref:Uncharacterized protein n=1 Tax=Dreissena polymorpha TaxID=45954 RepID=A0A9D4I636_DREPO|nr:hypothetical protein DPMN_184121 [Dreissena polymorpha]